MKHFEHNGFPQGYSKANAPSDNRAPSNKPMNNHVHNHAVTAFEYDKPFVQRNTITGVGFQDRSLHGIQQPTPRLFQKLIRTFSSSINFLLFVFLFLLMIVGSYALWDSYVLHENASSAAWEAYRPTQSDHGSFEDLQRENPDVIGWLNVFGTNIDYPVMYAEDNEFYLSHDPLKNYALTGSLFVESHNAPDFSDFATVVYGHHMEDNVMFGELGEFKDKSFFNDHQYGSLFIGKGSEEKTLKGIEFFAFLTPNAYDASIYNTQLEGSQTRASYQGNLAQKAVNTRLVDVRENDRLVLLSTCSSESTDGRYVLVGKISNEVFQDKFNTHEVRNGSGVDQFGGLFGFPWLGWIALLLLTCLLIAGILKHLARRSQKGEKQNALKNVANHHQSSTCSTTIDHQE